MIIRTVSILALIVGVSGCASHLSKNQCLNTDWYQKGIEDGVAGKQSKKIEKYITDCAKFSLKVDTKKYENGRNEGLKQYCTYQHGYDLALSGKLIKNVCVGDQTGQYDLGYHKGQKQFCQQTANAMRYGKDGKPYPELCNPSQYPLFKLTYDRGIAISNRMNAINSRIEAINHEISSETFHNDIHEWNGVYQASNKTPESDAALQHIQRLLAEKQYLESDLFNLKLMS